METWEAWWVASQVIETADPRDCHDWITHWAVAQYRANELEATACTSARAAFEGEKSWSTKVTPS